MASLLSRVYHIVTGTTPKEEERQEGKDWDRVKSLLSKYKKSQDSNNSERELRNKRKELLLSQTEDETPRVLLNGRLVIACSSSKSNLIDAPLSYAKPTAIDIPVPEISEATVTSSPVKSKSPSPRKLVIANSNSANTTAKSQDVYEQQDKLIDDFSDAAYLLRHKRYENEERRVFNRDRELAMHAKYAHANHQNTSKDSQAAKQPKKTYVSVENSLGALVEFVPSASSPWHELEALINSQNLRGDFLNFRLLQEIAERREGQYNQANQIQDASLSSSNQLSLSLSTSTTNLRKSKRLSNPGGLSNSSSIALSNDFGIGSTESSATVAASTGFSRNNSSSLTILTRPKSSFNKNQLPTLPKSSTVTNPPSSVNEIIAKSDGVKRKSSRFELKSDSAAKIQKMEKTIFSSKNRKSFPEKLSSSDRNLSVPDSKVLHRSKSLRISGLESVRGTKTVETRNHTNVRSNSGHLGTQDVPSLNHRKRRSTRSAVTSVSSYADLPTSDIEDASARPSRSNAETNKGSASSSSMASAPKRLKPRASLQQQKQTLSMSKSERERNPPIAKSISTRSRSLSGPGDEPARRPRTRSSSAREDKDYMSETEFDL